MKLKPIAGTICLMAGMAIYVLFRTNKLLGFSVAESMGLAPVINRLRCATAHLQPPYFVKFCLPDMLWTTAYMLFIDHVFEKHCLKQRWLWASIIPLVGILSELLQIPHIVPGTFDALDLLAYLLPLLVYTIIINL